MQDYISALVLGATQHETDLCNAFNNMRAFVDVVLVVQRRGGKTLSREKRRNSETELQEYSLTVKENFFTNISLENRMSPSEKCLIFSLEPLHNLHLGVYRKLKKCAAAILSLDIAVYPLGAEETCKNRFSLKRQLLTQCNNLITGAQARCFCLQSWN